MTDPREAEWAEHEAAQLNRGLCPHSGEELTADLTGHHHCEDCDCFGFDPKDPRMKGNNMPEGDEL